jgi:hypothetical protein
MNTLSLFPTYFLSAYTDRLSLNTARDTAASFTNFILMTAGAEALTQPIGQDDYRQEWLDSLGVTLPWQPRYNLSFLEDAQFSSSEDYELIITTDNRVYSFSDNFVDTPEPIMQLLAYLQNGMDNLLNKLQTDAPEHYPEIAAVWEAPIYYYFDGNLIGSYREPAKHSIYLSGPVTLYLFDELKGKCRFGKISAWRITCSRWLMSRSQVTTLSSRCHLTNSPGMMQPTLPGLGTITWPMRTIPPI